MSGRSETVLGSSTEKSISKVLLEYLSSDSFPPVCYRKYLSSCLSLKQSNTCMASLSDDLLGRFYMSHDPMAEPTYFSFYHGPDLCRLETALGLTIVVTMRKTATCPVRKYYDRRAYRRSWEGGETIFLELRGKAKNRESLVIVGEDYDHRGSEYKFIRRCSTPRGEDNCLVRMMAEALDRDEVAANHCHEDNYCSELLHVQTSFRRVVKELGTEVVLACHLGEIARGQTQFTAGNQNFGLLAANVTTPGTRVLVITPDRRFVYLLHEKYASRDVLAIRKNRMPHRGTATSSKHLARTSGKDDVEKMEQEDQWTKKPRTIPVTNIRNGCQCDPCVGADNFSKRMARKGPQQLYVIRMSSFDHLKFFGLLDKSTEELILLASDYSLAAFDSESLTEYLAEDETINEDATETVSGQSLPRVAVARQLPVLISHTSQFRHVSGLPIFRYRVDEENPDSFVGGFVEDLLTSKEEAMAAKKVLLRPLLDWLMVFKRAHYDHFDVPLEEEDDKINEEMYQEQEEEEEDIAAQEEDKRRRIVRTAYNNSMFGVFAKQLEDLSNRFTVFGLNSEAYDLPLLSASILVYLKNKKKRGIHIIREGSRVKSLSFQGVTIREAQKLLAPGFSLDSLASMCGLDSEIKKMRFPFDVFRTASFLDEPRLPARAEDWVNTLDKSKSISQAEVDEIQAYFDSREYSSVYQYMQEYLDTDVLLLLKSMVRLCRSYHEQLGLHPSDSNKWTVGSLSFLATQTINMRGKHIGNYFANNCQLYSVSVYSFWLVSGSGKTSTFLSYHRY